MNDISWWYKNGKLYVAWFEEVKPTCFVCNEPMDEGAEWWIHPGCAAKAEKDLLTLPKQPPYDGPTRRATQLFD